jgi:hypothetical protein
VQEPPVGRQMPAPNASISRDARRRGTADAHNIGFLRARYLPQRGLGRGARLVPGVRGQRGLVPVGRRRGGGARFAVGASDRHLAGVTLGQAMVGGIR